MGQHTTRVHLTVVNNLNTLCHCNFHDAGSPVTLHTADGRSTARVTRSSQTNLTRLRTKSSSLVPVRNTRASRTTAYPNLRVSNNAPTPAVACVVGRTS